MDVRMATCRKCGSTNIQAMKRGYTMTRGLFGMGDIITVCLDCGHKSAPGGTSWEKMQDQSREQTQRWRAEKLAKMTPEEQEKYLKEEYTGKGISKSITFSLLGIASMLGGCFGGCAIGSQLAQSGQDGLGTFMIFLFWVGGIILGYAFLKKAA